MYQPDPLNWMAGEDACRCTGPFPQTLHASGAGSENFWMISNRFPQASHSYSYSGIVAYPYSSTASVASVSSRRRCAQNGALPCASTASWKARSENFPSCCSL